jgi:hypothetical protein
MTFQRLCAAVLLSVASAWSAHAADVYTPSNNQLRVPLVEVSGRTYTDVLLTVDRVVHVWGGNPNGSIDTYNPALNQLSIPQVLVGTQKYTNVVITVGQVLSVGGEMVDGDFTATLVISSMPN